MISVNKIAALAAALSAPVLTGCVDQHWLSALQATDIGAVIATAVAFLHVNNDQARAALNSTLNLKADPARPSPFGTSL